MGKVLFHNCRYLITGAPPNGEILEDCDLSIEDAKIKAIGSADEVGAHDIDENDIEIIDCTNKIVMPGLVDAHNHVGEVHALLVEGWLDTPLTGTVDALNRVYWPADGWLTEESAYDLTLFGLLNMLKYGVTTHANASPLPNAVYQATVDAGVRAVIHPQMVTSVELHGMDERAHLATTEEVIQRYHNTHDGRIQVGIHPNCTFNCRQRLLLRSMELANEYDVQFVIHYGETPEEVDSSNALWASEGGLVQHFYNAGLLSPRTVIFHGTLLNEAEIDLLVETDTAVVHCPATNAWFGYCAYLPYMLKAGLRTGLGTDMPSHNIFNVMLSVLQHHAIMPRELRGIEPAKIFELATLGGAQVLGLENEIGTLQPGKRADVVTIDLSHNSSLFPLNSQVLFAMLVTNGAGTQVCDSMVNGVFLRRDGAFISLDEAAIIGHAQEWCGKFSDYYLASKQYNKPMIKRVHDDFLLE
jgi:cytosine/adenosine deaminase-related metal-dependent hydrolase